VHCEQVGKTLQLGTGGKFFVNDQVGGLDEARVLGQLLDRNATVAQDALFAVDKRDGALTSAGVPITVVKGDQPGLIAKLANVDRPLTGGTFNQT